MFEEFLKVFNLTPFGQGNKIPSPIEVDTYQHDYKDKKKTVLRNMINRHLIETDFSRNPFAIELKKDFIDIIEDIVKEYRSKGWNARYEPIKPNETRLKRGEVAPPQEYFIRLTIDKRNVGEYA